MKISAIGISILYLAPPVALLWLGSSYGSVFDVMSFLKLALRAALVAIVAVAIGIGISEKVKFLQVEGGVKFYFRFFPFYVVIFFLFNFLLGIELMHPQPNEFFYHR